MSTNTDILKQVLVLRTDLDLSAGKAAAQAAHASLWAANRADERVRDQWEEEAATKIVLAVSSEEELRELAEKARKNSLPTAVVNDLGRTEIDEGTTTALGVGPADVNAVDSITGDLSMY